MFWPRVEGSAPSGGPSLLRAQPITSIGEAGTRPRSEARSRDSALPQGVSLVWKVKRRNGNLRVSGSLGCSRLAGCYMISPEQTPEQARTAAEREPRADVYPKFTALTRGGGQGRSRCSREGYQPQPPLPAPSTLRSPATASAHRRETPAPS